MGVFHIWNRGRDNKPWLSYCSFKGYVMTMRSPWCFSRISIIFVQARGNAFSQSTRIKWPNKFEKIQMLYAIYCGNWWFHRPADPIKYEARHGVWGQMVAHLVGASPKILPMCRIKSSAEWLIGNVIVNANIKSVELSSLILFSHAETPIIKHFPFIR